MIPFSAGHGIAKILTIDFLPFFCCYWNEVFLLLKPWIKIEWNLDITNLYITKSSLQRTIFFNPAIIKYIKDNLDITKPRYRELILPVPWPFGLDGVNWLLTNGQNFNWQLTNSLKFIWQLTFALGFTDKWQRTWLSFVF